MRLGFITRTYTENTGGGCMVDFFELKDGRVLGLNDECIVLYPSAAAIYEGDSDGNYDFPAIWRQKRPDEVDSPKLGCYTDSLIEEYTVDVIVLATGEVLGVDAESICLYADLNSMMGAAPDCVVATIPLI